MKYTHLLALSLVAGLLAGCPTTTTSDLASQLEYADIAVQAAATTAKAAHDDGLTHTGDKIETALEISLSTARAALDVANTNLQAGQTQAVPFYLSETAAAITQITTQLATAKKGAN